MPSRPATLSPGRPSSSPVSGDGLRAVTGVTLVELAHPAATLTFDAVWHEGELPLIQRSLEITAELANAAGWL